MEYLFCYFLNFATNNLYLSASSRETFNPKYRLDVTEEFMKCFDYKSFLAGIKNADSEIYRAVEYEFLKTMMLRNKTEDTAFYSLKSLIKKNPRFFMKFLKEELILYKEILEGSLELETEANGYFPLHHFRNIILTVTELKHSKWLEEFLKKYIHFITPDLRNEISEYGSAHLLYSKNKFEETLEHTARIHYRHHVIQTDIIILRLQIFYQLNYFEEALYLTDSFRHFLINNKFFSEQQRNAYFSFIKYINMMIRHRTSNKPVDIKYLRNKVAGHLKLRNKYWLLEKIDELNKKGA